MCYEYTLSKEASSCVSCLVYVEYKKKTEKNEIKLSSNIVFNEIKLADVLLI